MDNEKSETVRRWFDEVWNKGNAGAITEILHPAANVYGLGEAAILGPSGFKPFHEAFINAYAAIHVTVFKTLVDGDYVTALCNVEAIHKQTGQSVKFSGASIGRVENGKITEGWNYFDFQTMNLQIGKIKPEQLA